MDRAGLASTATGQEEVIAWLSSGAAFGTNAPLVERIDTHVSVVWLAGPRAYKLKRAVRFDYVDYSTVELRRAACEAEVRVNRRTAPSLYRGVRAVTREADGSLCLGGRGVPVDWLVEMERFDGDTLFDRLAERRQLDVALMDDLAEAIVRLHVLADPRADHGGVAGMTWVVEGNARGFDEQSEAGLERNACEDLTSAARAAVGLGARMLEARRVGGAVRDCHGDLHLRNICLVSGIPTLFDAIEFNDDISCVDVLYDLAFLLMDLWHRELPAHANRVLNAYLERSVDLEGLSLLPLFLSCRAAVRAKISLSSAAVQVGQADAQGLRAAARQYLGLARRFLSPPPARLVAVGGLSGSGKTTLARGLAPGVGAAPGALILRSDTIRKTLSGVAPSTRLGPDGYAPAVTRRVYQTIADRASRALNAGHAVIADAVYANPGDREEIAAVARDSGVPFTGFWIEGPQEVLARRLRGRVGDSSDATADVLDRQLERDVGPLHWHRLDGSLDAGSVQRSAERALQ